MWLKQCHLHHPPVTIFIGANHSNMGGKNDIVLPTYPHYTPFTSCFTSWITSVVASQSTAFWLQESPTWQGDEFFGSGKATFQFVELWILLWIIILFLFWNLCWEVTNPSKQSSLVIFLIRYCLMSWIFSCSIVYYKYTIIIYNNL